MSGSMLHVTLHYHQHNFSNRKLINDKHKSECCSQLQVWPACKCQAQGAHLAGRPLHQVAWTRMLTGSSLAFPHTTGQCFLNTARNSVLPPLAPLIGDSMWP